MTKKNLPSTDELNIMREHMTLAQIAELYDVHKTTISRRLTTVKKPKRPPNSRANDMLRLFAEDNMSLRHIAKRYNISYQRVSQILQHHPDFHQAKCSKLAKHLPFSQRLLDLHFLHGYSLARISVETKISEYKVKQAIYNHPNYNIAKRIAFLELPHGKLPSVAELFRLYTVDKMSASAIAKRYKVNQSSVHTLLRRHPDWLRVRRWIKVTRSPTRITNKARV